MSDRDDRIVESDPNVQQDVVALREATQKVKEGTKEQHRIAKRLMRRGLSTRFIATVVGKSHQTVGSWRHRR